MSERKVVIYLRTSRNGDDASESLADQEHACRKAAERLGAVHCTYCEIVSGEERARPALSAMVADAERGEFQAVVTADASRLGRDVARLAQVVDRLGRAGASIHYVQEFMPRS